LWKQEPMPARSLDRMLCGTLDHPQHSIQRPFNLNFLSRATVLFEREALTCLKRLQSEAGVSFRSMEKQAKSEFQNKTLSGLITGESNEIEWRSHGSEDRIGCR
jgi:hypothetical protein